MINELVSKFRMWRGLRIADSAQSTGASLQKVLQDVNFIRTALLMGEGKLETLPAGDPNDPEHCVLANALSNGWSPYVDGDLVLAHSAGEVLENMNWERTLTKLNARFGPGCSYIRMWRYERGSADFEWNLDDYVVEDRQHAASDDDTVRVGFYIPGTDEMDYLIEDFDKSLLPDLILNG
jgi:hypothetical protein